MKTLTLEVPDEVFEALERAAAVGHHTVEEVAVGWLTKAAAEHRTARKSFRDYRGAVSSGDPHSGDNDRIDADLAREYANNHEDE